MTLDSSQSFTCPVCGAPVTETQQFCGTCGSGLRGQRARERRRVVVTGLGAVCAVGLSARESWGNILEGKSGIKRIPMLAEGSYSCQVRGDLDEHLPNRFLDTKTARNTSQFSLWLLEAAGAALIAAGLIDDDGNPIMSLLPGGSVIGTCVGGCYDDLLAAYDTFHERGPDKLSPHLHVKFPLEHGLLYRAVAFWYGWAEQYGFDGLRHRHPGDWRSVPCGAIRYRSPDGGRSHRIDRASHGRRWLFGDAGAGDRFQ